MTITTVQYQVVETAVNAILNGEEVADLFDGNKVTPHTENGVVILVNHLQLMQAFEIDTDQKPNHIKRDLEIVIDTLEKVAQNIVDMYSMDIFAELADNHDFDETCDIIENERLHVYYGVHNMADLAEQWLEETGSLAHVAKDSNYIDEQALLRDLYMGGDIQDFFYHQAKEDALEEGKEEEEARQIASDYEITSDDEENYMEMVLDSISHDVEWLTRYFCYESYGRDMELEGTFYSFNDGMIEVVW